MTTPIKEGRGFLVHEGGEERIPGRVVGSDHEGFWFLPDYFDAYSMRFSYAEGWTVEFPKPELPTERGSVILDVLTENGREYKSAYLYSTRSWIGLRDVGSFWDTLRDDDIIEFTPAKVVAA